VGFRDLLVGFVGVLTNRLNYGISGAETRIGKTGKAIGDSNRLKFPGLLSYRGGAFWRKMKEEPSKSESKDCT
jgi:hypothetical protein